VNLYTYNLIFTNIKYKNGDFIGCIDKNAKKDPENGFCRLVYNDGSIFEGINKCGYRCGHGRYIHFDGEVTEINY